MFEQTETGLAVHDCQVASIPPAPAEVSPAEVSPADDGREAAGPARLWREMLPDPQMIEALASVSLQACTDSELLDVLAGWQRVEAWVSAQQTRALERTRERLLETAVREETTIDGHTPWQAVYRQVETEISTALGWTSRFTGYRLETAETLTHKLPAALDAMAAGQLTYRHADVICDETAILTDDQARQIVERLLPEASTRTVGGLRRRLRKACLQIDPESGNERAKKAATERSVTIRPLSDGQAQLQAIGPAESILAMFRTLDETADRHAKADPRTRTARRFDALVDFVITAGWTGDCPPPPKIPILAQITMDLPTALGLQNNPAELPGYGPLPASLARALAVDAQWQRFIQDPVTGAPQDLGRTRRHPDAAMRRWIIARDRTCLFPECYRPAADCEPDHNPAWQHNGQTNKDTLHQLCPKHHKVRHHGWSYERHPDRVTWISPHQEIYERYLTEADLISSTDLDPEPQADFDDAIWPPTDEDQRLHIFVPTRPGKRPDPDDDIPWDVVEAFRLEDPASPWTSHSDYDPEDELILTPEREQALIDDRHFRLYGSDEPLPPDHTRTVLDRAKRRQAFAELPDDPPF